MILSNSNGSSLAKAKISNISSSKIAPNSLSNEILTKDQNVPNMFKYVSNDPSSQRYINQLSLGMNKNGFGKTEHYLDDQECDDTGPANAEYLSNYNNIENKLENSKQLDEHYQINGGAIKRGCDDVEGETEDDNGTLSSSSSLCSSRRSPPKKPKFIVTYKEIKEFFALLNEESIREFLKRDTCCLISDKYALAMVFTYFKRAKFYLNEFTRINFYLALYLASDIEEDVDEYKYEIFPWALGGRWRSKFSGFLRKRDALLRRIGYRAIVSRKCCEEVMNLAPDHSAWKRERSEDHGGATRAYLINRSRRFLSNRNNLDEEELNLPRGPFEKPRPCPLCLVNRSINSSLNATPINQFNPITIGNYNDLYKCQITTGFSEITNEEKKLSESLNDQSIESSLTYNSALNQLNEHTNKEIDENNNSVTINQEQQKKSTSKKMINTPRKILKSNKNLININSDKDVHCNENPDYENKANNDINGSVSRSNNNVSVSKINNLVLSENSFIFKNTSILNYSQLISSTENKQKNTENQTSKNPSIASTSNLGLNDKPVFCSDDDDITDDDDCLQLNCKAYNDENNDEVFTNFDYEIGDPILSINKKKQHNSLNNNKTQNHYHANCNIGNGANKRNLNQKKLSQISLNRAQSNNTADILTNKRINFSLSAKSALPFTSFATTIASSNAFNSKEEIVSFLSSNALNDKSKLIKSETDNLSISKCNTINDQLVPRDQISNK